MLIKILPALYLPKRRSQPQNKADRKFLIARSVITPKYTDNLGFSVSITCRIGIFSSSKGLPKFWRSDLAIPNNTLSISHSPLAAHLTYNQGCHMMSPCSNKSCDNPMYNLCSLPVQELHCERSK